MNIKILLLDNHDYTISDKSIPIVVKFYSNNKIEIATKIDLKELALKKGNNELLGFDRTCQMGIISDTINIDHDLSYFELYDINQYKEEIEFLPGIYDAYIKLIVYIKNKIGKFEELELESSKKIEIK